MGVQTLYYPAIDVADKYVALLVGTKQPFGDVFLWSEIEELERWKKVAMVAAEEAEEAEEAEDSKSSGDVSTIRYWFEFLSPGYWRFLMTCSPRG